MGGRKSHNPHRGVMAVWKEMKKYSLQCTKARNDLGGESQCGGIQIHRCPRIFLRGGVYLQIIISL